MEHNPKRRRIGISAVRDTDGNIILGKDDSQRFLGRFLEGGGAKFEENQIVESQSLILVRKVSKAFPETCWIMSWVSFLSMMIGLTNSSPGTDGVPYGG